MFGVKSVRILVKIFFFNQFRESTFSFVKTFGLTSGIPPMRDIVGLVLMKKIFLLFQLLYNYYSTYCVEYNIANWRLRFTLTPSSVP